MNKYTKRTLTYIGIFVAMMGAGYGVNNYLESEVNQPANAQVKPVGAKKIGRGCYYIPAHKDRVGVNPIVYRISPSTAKWANKMIQNPKFNHFVHSVLTQFEYINSNGQREYKSHMTKRVIKEVYILDKGNNKKMVKYAYRNLKHAGLITKHGKPTKALKKIAKQEHLSIAKLLN